MKRPSFQFYPADWSANSNLRRCTHEEKGIWIDVMCLLHDQEEYGVARWPLKEIAQAVGCTLAKLRGLVTKGVIKGADAGGVSEPLIYIPRSGRKEGPAVTLIDAQSGPIWFSSRMVIDEYKRVLRGEYGAAPKASPDPSPKGGIGAAPKASPDPSPKGGIGAAPKASPDPSPFTCAPGQAPRAAPSSSSSSSPSVNPSVVEHTDNSIGGTLAGAVCARLKSECRIVDVSPSHPKLIALLDAGLTDDEIVSAGHEAMAKGKGFAYALAVADGRRRDAATVKPLPTASPQRRTIHDQRSETIAALTGRNRTDERPATEPRDITGEATRIA